MFPYKLVCRYILAIQIVFVLAFMSYMHMNSNIRRITAERDCYLEHLRNMYTGNDQNLDKLIARHVWKTKKDEQRFKSNKEVRIQQLMCN